MECPPTLTSREIVRVWVQAIPDRKWHHHTPKRYAIRTRCVSCTGRGGVAACAHPCLYTRVHLSHQRMCASPYTSLNALSTCIIYIDSPSQRGLKQAGRCVSTAALTARSRPPWGRSGSAGRSALAQGWSLMQHAQHAQPSLPVRYAIGPRCVTYREWE